MRAAPRPRAPSPHWKRLGLVDGAAEPAIEAAWLWQIAAHHPDRGGDVEIARQINVAHDELKGAGTKPNEYVAAHYDAQPWLVLGVARDADIELARRVGRQLAGDLGSHPRLAERVQWAVANFGQRVTPPAPADNGAGTRVRLTPPPRPTPRRTEPLRPTQRPVPGLPDGLVARVDFGDVERGQDIERSLKLTWKRFAPFDVTVNAPSPLRASAVGSKAVPGRFVITLTIDWEAEEFADPRGLRGYTLDETITLRWAGGGEADVRVRGTILYPAIVSASPTERDFGTVEAKQPVRTTIVFVSTGAAMLEIEPPAWLARVDASNRPLTVPLRLAANTPLRAEFAVQWEPILRRAAASFAERRPVRPTGRITVRWNEQQLEIPVQIVVRPPAKVRS